METAFKKLAFVIIFISAIFIVAPAFAELAVTLDYNQPNGTVAINYTGADANSQSTMPRAFALEITIDSPGEITDVSGYKNDWIHDNNGPDETGESNSLYPGFGIYPARISWYLPPGDDSCDVKSWGTPLADDINDPGAGDGLYSNHIVLELASLYYGDVNRPGTSGTLCKLEINCNGGMNLLVHMTDEDTYRGGLVFEDSSKGDIDVNIVVCKAADCDEPVPPTTPTPADAAVGVSTYPTKPTLSWSPAAGGDNPRYDVYFGTETTPVTVVSPNQTATSYLASTAVQGKTYYWKIVAKNDCNPTGVSSAIWSFNTDCLKNTAPEYADWVIFGKPDCWCYQRHCHGDYNGTGVGTGGAKKWVTGTDLTAFKAAHNKQNSVLPPGGICADFNHAGVPTTYSPAQKRITGTDLTIFKNYYNKREDDPTYPNTTCPNDNYNFWTN